MCVKRERKGGEHSGSSSSWRAKKGGGRGEGRVRKLVWLAEQLFTPLSPLHHHPPLLFPILLCILWRWQGESFIAPSWYRSGPLSEGSQTREYRRHFCNVHNLPPYLSFLLLLYISFSFCFAFSHTLFLCHLCGLGIKKITVWRCFRLYLPERFLRECSGVSNQQRALQFKHGRIHTNLQISYSLVFSLISPFPSLFYHLAHLAKR